MVMAAKLTPAQIIKIKRAVKENVLDKTANKVGPKAGSTRKTVSDKEARDAAKTMNQANINRGGKAKAGLKPLTEYIGRKSGGQGAAQLTARPGTIKSGKKTLVVKRQSTRVTPAEVRELRAKERNARLKRVLTPLNARGTRAGSTTVAGPKEGSKVQIAKASPATTRAKIVIPKDTKLDASRKAAMKAAEEARSQKTAAQREQEQRLDTNASRTNIKDKTTPEQREADRRAAQGTKNFGPKAKPESKPTTIEQSIEKARAADATKKAAQAKAAAKQAAAQAKLTPAQKAAIRATARAAKTRSVGLTSSGGSRGTFTGSSSGKVGITYTK